MKKLVRSLPVALAAFGMVAIAAPSMACEGKKMEQQTTTNTTDAKKQGEQPAKADANKAPATKSNARPNS